MNVFAEGPKQDEYAPRREDELVDALNRIGEMLGADIEAPTWDPTLAVGAVAEVFGTEGTLDVEALEHWAIVRALKVTRGNCRAAARKLKISKTKLYRKIRDLKIKVPGR
jgi:transcriptional regulator of acetoin/glycerol metabolism